VTTQFDHQPVLLRESIANLNLQSGFVVLDGTIGGGGHAAAILKQTAPNGILIGLDRDADALEATEIRLAQCQDRIHLVQASFREMSRVVRELGFEYVDGVLLDLGVSSHQLDVAERGFRFAERSAQATPLDMRMDRSCGPTAAELLKRASASELQSWFQNYGELPGSKRLAQAIVEARRRAPIATTADLLCVIRDSRIGGGRRHNPATLVFQALRIAVNDELETLRQGLTAALEVLRPGARLVVIAYHSLEDRIVKRLFRAAAKGCSCPPRTPICICGETVGLRIITRRPVMPSRSEIEANARARSGRLRAAERVQQEAA
jgi:16S rRNA (cytosine1402-N4)-methyltransferase